MKIQQRNNIVQLTNIILILIGLAIVLLVNLNFYYLIAVLLISIVISKSIGLLLSTRTKRSAQEEKNLSPIISCNPYNVKPLEQLLTYDLTDLSESDFQELCFQYFKSTYRKVEQIQMDKDSHLNFILVNREGSRVAVQVKHKMESGKNVINNEINSLIEAKKIHNCTYAMVISTTDYTQDARDIAAEHKIAIYTYRWVENKVLRWREKESHGQHLKIKN